MAEDKGEPGDRGPRGYRGDEGERGYRGGEGDRGPPGPMGEEWDHYRKLVVHELKDLSDQIRIMDKQNRTDHMAVVAELGNVKSELAALKVKASFYGAVAGLGSGIVIFFAQLFGRGLGH